MPVTPSRVPRISVIVPVYNVERYLNQCLRSLEEQTFSDFEVICVNDGSTDGSVDIIRSYVDRDHRFHLLDKMNSGYGDSMNRGIAEASGEYIGILESDDFYERNALELLYRAAKSSDADFVKANFFLYWSAPEERREFFEVVTPHRARTGEDQFSDPSIFFQKPSIWSALYRRSFLEANAIRFLPTPGAAYQDTSFSFKVLALAEHPAFIHEAVLNYRQDNESSSVNQGNKAYAVCGEYAEIDRWMSSLPRGSRAKSLKKVELLMKYDAYMWNYVRLTPELRRDFLHRMAEEYRASQRAGEFDLRDFPSWKRANLAIIMNDPDEFQRRSPRYADAGTAGRALHYLRIGGPLVLIDYVRNVLAERRRRR